MRAERSSRARRARVAVAVALASLTVACGDGSEASVRVVIPSGANMRVAAESLAAAGVVSSPKMFRFYASARKRDRSIKAGTYMLRRGARWSSVLDALRDGKGLVHVVTIPEGFTLAQIERALATKLTIPAESLHAATRDTSLLHALDVPAATLEGYLFPDTYTFPDRTTARQAVQAMARRFEQIWKPAWTARLDTVVMTRHDVLTLASIVEREARLGAERPVIAAVYVNRLRAGMLLQADPTVQYALPVYQSRLLYKHLEVKSPYNTYKYKGLPPGPIASPGRASIEAALYPAAVPYRYFVAFPDGHHEFRVSAKDHERAKAAARRAWDSTAAKRVR